MLSEANVLAIMEQLPESLSVAHAQGVGHRDIKPANLIVTKTGQVKLIDFGIARLADANLTQVSSMIATPAYMAPEQFTGKGIDHRADLFACGVLLYRMLTGRRAFTGATEQGMYKILNEVPPPPSVVTNGLRPATFDAVVARAIAKNPADRYPDAQAMRAALQAISRAPATAKATVILPLPSRDGEPMRLIPSGVSPSSASPVARDPIRSSGTDAIGGTGVVPAGWDPAELQRIERAFATHVGPRARVMIRAAARRHADPASLASAVGRHIPDQHKRQQFIEQARSGSQVTAIGSPMASGATSIAQPAPATAIADPLSDDFKAQVAQIVTRKMGSIARVMVKRAADAAGGSRARFLETLLAGIAESDRRAVQGEIDELG